MDDDHDLRKFSGLSRLFPLPDVVLFPHAVIPLHIFEPRYRQMTEDALASDQLVTMVQLRPAIAGASSGLGLPPIEEVGCLGRIIQHERLDDGRFNFLLLGRKRVRLLREVRTGKPYRTAEVEVIDDLTVNRPEEPRRSELTDLFKWAFECRATLDPDLVSILENALPLGVLADIVAHAIGFSSAFKQRLLAEPRVDVRVDSLLSVLRRMSRDDADGASDGRTFPPPFSAN